MKDRNVLSKDLPGRAAKADHHAHGKAGQPPNQWRHLVFEAGELILDRQSFFGSLSGHLVVILGNRRLLYGSSTERAPSLVEDGEFTTPVVPDTADTTRAYPLTISCL